MNTYADKTQESKNRSDANDLSKKKQSGRGSPFQFVDNRPEAIAQRKLQEMANNSPQIRQLRSFQEMANNSPQAKQAAQLRAMVANQAGKPMQKKKIEKAELQMKPNPFQNKENPSPTLPTASSPLSGINRDEEVFLALTGPTAEDAATFYGHDEFQYPTLGFTTMIVGHDGPDIDYGIVEGPDGKTATPTRSATSEEGTNYSWSLAVGTHQVPGVQVNQKDLYVILSPEIADSVQAAEEEHVADYRYAKEKILDKSDTWLNENLGARSFGGSNSDDVLEDHVDAYINNRLKPHLGLTGVNDFQWANIGSYYKKAANQTNKRDENNWHSFGNADDEQVDRVNRTITTGDSEVGTHDSSSVVNLTEVEG